MYADEEVKRGTPVRDFLLKLILVIIFVLLLLWLLPARINSTLNNTNSGNSNGGSENTTNTSATGNVDLTALTNRIFNANIQEMKEAAILYYTTERLPQTVGSDSKMTLKEMIDKHLLLEFTDKNGNTCDANNSYVQITKEENEYLMKVYLKCNDDEDYILVHVGCYSYCNNPAGVCEKQETKKTGKTVTIVTPKKQQPVVKKTTTPGPGCTLEIASGALGEDGWYVGNVKVKFASKYTTASGAKIKAYGITTSATATYNNNTALTISKDGTTKVYGYVKDSNGKTAICNITVKKDTVDPDCKIDVLKGTMKDNGTFTGTVKIGFRSRTDATSGVKSYGLSESTKVSYNGKASINVSGNGSHTVYGYVKDKAGHTKVCKKTISIKNEDKAVESHPNCVLEVKSGTLGSNSWYRSNVTVGFKSKTTDNGAKIVAYGIGKSKTYGGNKTYTISEDGRHYLFGYVKDSNGYVSVCSIYVKRDATKPNCNLSVIYGTYNSSGYYTSNIVIGFKDKYDKTSGMYSYGIGKSTTYEKNASYTITTAGTHTVYGYVKDYAGNTNICSIKVTKKEKTYEYQYSKKFAAQYGSWSSWTTKKYECSNPPKFVKTAKYESVDLGSTKVVSGYEYSNGDAITAKDIKETGTVSEKSCVGWKYYRTTTTTTSTTTSTTTKTYAIKTTSTWGYTGLVSLSSPPTNTLSTKYVFVGMDWDRCGSSCTTTPYTTWKKYSRSVGTVTGADTIVSTSSSSSSSSSVTTKCSDVETKNTILYTTYNKVVGYEQKRTIKYTTVCKWKYRTRSLIKEAYTDYKWSKYNDTALLNAGYKYTGVKRLTSN